MRIKCSTYKPGGLGLRAVVGAFLALALVVAACGSDSSDDASDAPAEDTAAAPADDGAAEAPDPNAACMAAAEAFLADYDTPPTSLPPAFTPLAAAPEPGGHVIILANAAIPSDVETAGELETAVQPIGWTTERIIFDGTVEDIGVKFLQAVDQQPTVITVAGWPVAVLQAGIDAAAEAGIVVSLSSVPDAPISNPGYAANSNGAGPARLLEEVNAFLFMRDSGCTGNVLSLTAPFDILTLGMESFDATIAANCPNCQATTLNVLPADIGTPAMTSTIVSAAQADRSIKHVHAMFGNLATGLYSALDQAGISDVRIFGNVPDTNAIQALQDGTNAWWLTQNSITQAWQALDAALRAVEAQEVVTMTQIPFGVLTPENVDPDATTIQNFPENFRELFAEVWQVGG